MVSSALVALLATAVAASAASSPGFLKMDFEKRSVPSSPYRLMRRGGGAVDALLTENSNMLEYLINITVGTPPQHMAVTLDTGSSDLWVPAVSSQPCKQNKCDDGSYDPSMSSTYVILAENGFNITYAGPGDSDAGNWASESITVGGSPTITNMTIGVSLNGFDSHGVMGIGYDTNEAMNPVATNGIYPSSIDQMVNEGIIQRKAYSLYLNDMQSGKGSVIFGGIDSTKYTGELGGLALQLSQLANVSEFYVTLTSVTFTDHTGAVNQLSPQGYSQAVLLDSGTSATLLTNDVYQAITGGMGALTYQTSQVAVPCAYANSNATINYQFGGNGPTISVPMSQLVGNQVFPPDQFSDPSGGCDFGVGPPIQGSAILGDTFLRSAYAVFDLDNNVAALAQAQYNVTSSSIVTIPSGTALPSVSSTATATGTQLSGFAAQSQYSAPTFSMHKSTAIAGTPTFNLGVSPTSGSAGGSSSGAAITLAPKQAALIGAGLMMGAMAL